MESWLAGLVSRWPGSGWEPLCVANRKTGNSYRRAPAIREDGPVPWLPVSQHSVCPGAKQKPASPSSVRNNRRCKHPSATSIIFLFQPPHPHTFSHPFLPPFSLPSCPLTFHAQHTPIRPHIPIKTIVQ